MAEQPTPNTAPQGPILSDEEISARLQVQLNIPGLDISDILAGSTLDQKKDLSHWVQQIETSNGLLETRMQMDQQVNGLQPIAALEAMSQQQITLVYNKSLSQPALDRIRINRKKILERAFAELARQSEELRKASAPKGNIAELQDSNLPSIIDTLNKYENEILYGDIPEDQQDTSSRNPYFYKRDVLLPKFGYIYTKALPKIEETELAIQILLAKTHPAEEQIYYESLKKRTENLLKAINTMESMDPAKAVTSKLRIEKEHGILSLDEKIMKGSAIGVAAVFTALSAVPAVMKMIQGKDLSDEEILGSAAYAGILAYLTRSVPGMNMDKTQAQTIVRVSILALQEPFQSAIRNITEDRALDAAQEFNDEYIVDADKEYRAKIGLLKEYLQNNRALDDDFLDKFTWKEISEEEEAEKEDEAGKKNSKIYQALWKRSEADRKAFLSTLLQSRMKEKGGYAAMKSAIIMVGNGVAAGTVVQPDASLSRSIGNVGGGGSSIAPKGPVKKAVKPVQKQKGGGAVQKTSAVSKQPSSTSPTQVAATPEIEAQTYDNQNETNPLTKKRFAESQAWLVSKSTNLNISGSDLLPYVIDRKKSTTGMMAFHDKFADPYDIDWEKYKKDNDMKT